MFPFLDGGGMFDGGEMSNVVKVEFRKRDIMKDFFNRELISSLLEVNGLTCGPVENIWLNPDAIKLGGFLADHGEWNGEQ